jgi:hypothetical protein
MALPWVRLDTGFPSNPKVLHLTSARKHRAVAVYVFSLAYAGGHGTDGFIPTAALPFIHGNEKDAEALVNATLWHPCMGGWQINGWAEYQPSTKEHEKRKESLRRSSAKANCIRHHGKDCGCWAR